MARKALCIGINNYPGTHMDLQTSGSALTDDEIHILFGARKAGVRRLLISDSCHSGTVTRAAPAEPEAEAPRPRFMSMGNWLPENRLPRTPAGNLVSQLGVAIGPSPFQRALAKQQGDLLLAGCKEGPNNYSYDAKIGGRYNGAFTVIPISAWMITWSPIPRRRIGSMLQWRRYFTSRVRYGSRHKSLLMTGLLLPSKSKA